MNKGPYGLSSAPWFSLVWSPCSQKGLVVLILFYKIDQSNVVYVSRPESQRRAPTTKYVLEIFDVTLGILICWLTIFSDKAALVYHDIGSGSLLTFKAIPIWVKQYQSHSIPKYNFCCSCSCCMKSAQAVTQTRRRTWTRRWILVTEFWLCIDQDTFSMISILDVG